MKAWMMILLVISVAVIVEQSEAIQGRKTLNLGEFNPCLGPNPPATCHHHNNPRVPANANLYSRGCNKFHRCQRE
ncbi:Protein RALF-like 26 [Cardamine amara subsp. amara]|uniref:Protein RALF-like 26 n=1 Tax=Cardamine amara subsp. amara TaxID=228776 RepID=A0ABD0ZID9_CARAN